MTEISSIENFENREKEYRKKLTRKYSLILCECDQVKHPQSTPLWASEMFYWQPEDLQRSTTTASLTLLSALQKLDVARLENICVLICKDRTGWGAQPIISGYWQWAVDKAYARNNSSNSPVSEIRVLPCSTAHVELTELHTPAQVPAKEESEQETKEEEENE